MNLECNSLLDWALTFHMGDKPPVVSHFIAERLPKHEKEEKENWGKTPFKLQGFMPTEMSSHTFIDLAKHYKIIPTKKENNYKDL